MNLCVMLQISLKISVLKLIPICYFNLGVELLSFNQCQVLMSKILTDSARMAKKRFSSNFERINYYLASLTLIFSNRCRFWALSPYF